MKSLGQQHSLLHYCSLATLFLYYLISISSTVSLVSSQCVDILNPLDPFDSKSRTFSACPPVNEANTNSLLLNNDNNSVSSTNNSMIKILFTCGANDDPKMCEKAKSAFEEAANFITNTINLQVPITLNASFFNICGVMITCPPGKPPFIGAASTSRYIPFLDDDNVVRLYPQALAKQFKFERHPEYLPLDIVSGFNSAVNVFWFKGDPPIRDDQVDFRLVVTHEIMHGLGLLSSWADYFSSDAATGLTTFPSFLFKETFENVTGEITFTGFQENCFDRRLHFASNNQSLDDIMTQLNKFAGGVENKTKFSGFDDFRSQFVNSSIFQTYAVDMLKQATTNDSILFRAHDDDGSNSDPIFIETSIVPYRAGSSMTHLDSITNNHTLDFLMMWRVPRGATAENLTSINGGNTSYTNPIGPKTIKILETLGYQTANYKNPYRPKDIVISNTT